MTAEFLETFGRFSKSDQRRFIKALELLDTNEKHPSLRVHALGGPLEGVWSASASDNLRLEFARGEGATKLMLRCSRHYRG